jgi:phospholipase C
MSAVTRRGSAIVLLSVLTVAACSSGKSSSAPPDSTSPSSASSASPSTTTTVSPKQGLIENIDHLVVEMQENRSYDSYFGQLDPAQQSKTGNPNPKDKTAPAILPFENPRMCETSDVEHGWDAVHDQIDGGKMDNFTATNVDETDPTGARAMANYGPKDLPFYYGIAHTFGIGDRYFASVPGPTYPNRYYLVAGTSFGHIDNTLPPAGGWTQKTIFEELEAAHISWKIYSSQVSVTALFFKWVHEHSAGHAVPIAQYYADAAAGTLPQVAFVDPTFIGKVDVEDDEHPPANPQVGQQFSAKIVNALMASPEWSSSAYFQIWDEHGGYFDHVPPPAAPVPDGIAPIGGKGAFDSYGIRVPLLVVSPWSRPGYVSHVVHDHTSILKTIEDRFGLPPLTHRDAQAAPLTEFFDFSHPTYATPPKLPAATVSAAGAAQCAALYKDKTLGL